jgi:hypothetical protein
MLNTPRRGLLSLAAALPLAVTAAAPPPRRLGVAVAQLHAVTLPPLDPAALSSLRAAMAANPGRVEVLMPGEALCCCTRPEPTCDGPAPPGWATLENVR